MSLHVKHYGVMWIAFVMLVFISAFGLEIAEGMKVKTTEYYGFTNLGGMYFVIIFILTCLPATALYFVAVVPLSVILRKGTSVTFLIRTVFFIGLGASAGKFLFYEKFQDHLILQYGLNELTAMIIFGACGIAYSLMDTVLASRIGWVTRKSH